MRFGALRMLAGNGGAAALTYKIQWASWRRALGELAMDVIGADAETDWLPPEIARDEKGYVLTGSDVAAAGRWELERDPYLLETSVPGIFACGDVRYGPVKRVAAAPGDTVCALGQEIFIDGQWRAKRRLSDGRGRTMPWWQGCTTLRDGALFLLTDNPASFDGRYFGSTEHTDVIGRAQLLWSR